MPYLAQDREHGLELRERRARTRLHATSLVLVDLGHVKGIAFNICEDGLALSAGTPLPADNLSSIWIQFPESADWIRVDIEIAWHSESKKEAGVRFVDLTDQARRGITSWISANLSSSDSRQESESLREEPAGLAETTNALTGSSPEVALHGGSEAWDSGVSTEPGALPHPLEMAVAKPALESRPDTAGIPDQPKTGLPVRERRVHRRERIVPLGYLQLGESNGGIAMNVSEAGIAITAAVALTANHLPSIRLQFPDSNDWIEAAGEVVWRSESQKEAGVRFTALTLEARRQIAGWISTQSSPASSSEGLARGEETESQGWEAPKSLPPDNFLSEPRMLEEAVKARPDHLSCTASLALPDSDTLVTASAAHTSPRKRSETRASRRSKLAYHRRNARVRALVALAVPLVLLSLSVKWFTQRSAVRNKIVTFLSSNALVWRPALGHVPHISANTRSIANKASAPNPRVAKVLAPIVEKIDQPAGPAESAPAGKAANVDAAPETNIGPRVSTLNHSSAHPILRTPKVAGEALTSREVRAKRRLRNVIRPSSDKTGRQTPVPVAPPPLQLEAKVANPLDAIPAPPKSAPPMLLLGKPSSPPPSPRLQEVPARVTGSVEVVADPYPSLRVPAERSAKKSRRGMSLQLGHLSSRVEPSYPEGARQQGVEGTVKMHLVIGRDGSVENLTAITGPPLLASIAASAVRQWRYTETLLAGQPVETEEDVAITFRLSTLAAAAK
jgi:outer membrane biosynthesis protein TonB